MIDANSLNYNTSFLSFSTLDFQLYAKKCINRLTPNDPYMGRTAPLTSKRCIYIFIEQI